MKHLGKLRRQFLTKKQRDRKNSGKALRKAAKRGFFGWKEKKALREMI